MVTMASSGYTLPPPHTLPDTHEENGRLYHNFRRGMYIYPCDEAEKDRMDIYHKIFLVARRDQLHQTPLNTQGERTRMLDLGCGTGIWAIDMADKYPHAEVVGLDLVNIQPEKIPPNLRFRVNFNYEEYWTLGQDSWDLIHMRMAAGSVSSWPELYQKTFLHLKPGTGWLEQVEIDLEPRCDDNTLPPNSILDQWYNWVREATERAGRPIQYRQDTRLLLQSAGFIDINETVIRAPYNSWPADPHQREIGRWYNLGLSEGLEALSLGPLTRVNNWPVETVRHITADVRRLICTRRIHAYNNIHIWTARRPVQ